MSNENIDLNSIIIQNETNQNHIFNIGKWPVVTNIFQCSTVLNT